MNKIVSLGGIFSLIFSFPLNVASTSKTWELKKTLLKERNNPAVRAFLDTIAYAEGTYHERARGYYMRYPQGTTFDSCETHPAITGVATCCGREIRSTAAGRYMFLEKTWNTVAQRLDLSDFSPLNQDVAALYLMHERGALDDIKQGNIRTALDKVKSIWASLPGSPHQQPIKKYETLRNVYFTRYNHYKKYLHERGIR